MPPLPEFHLKGVKCGGLSDLYYVSAVVIKQFIDEKEKATPVSFEQHEKELKEALTTLITLTSDSGLYSAANKHLSNALSLSTLSTEERNEFLFRGLLLTPTVFESVDQLVQTRQKLDIYTNALHDSMRIGKLSLKELNEFVLSPTFYYIYYGFNDKVLLSNLFSFYSLAFPSISNYSALSSNIELSQKHREDQQLQQGLDQPKRRIRIGFVSNYFRRHSICKLFCNIIVGLSESHQFDVFIFSSLQENHEDQTTQNIRRVSNRPNSHLKFISVGKTLIYNRNEVTDRRIDILVYLDIGMDPSTTVWAASKLAPVQMVLWGHPSTTGLSSIDYYLSSEKYYLHSVVTHDASSYSTESNGSPLAIPTPLHLPVDGSEASGIPVEPQSFFLEQLVRFETLNFIFEKPSLSLQSLFPSQNWRDIVSSHAIEYFTQLASYITSENEKKASDGKSRLLELLADKLFSAGSDEVKYILCPQHLPKFHPSFDEVLIKLVSWNVTNGKRVKILLLNNADKKLIWQRTLMTRWQNALMNLLGISQESAISLLNETIVWMPSLSPEEYLLLLLVGDIMIDPFPFGGGVTVLESLAMCTPVITLPSHQNVPQLAGGMLHELFAHASSEDPELIRSLEDSLIVRSTEQYLQSIDLLLFGQHLSSPNSQLYQLRKVICENHDLFYVQSTSSETEKRRNAYYARSVNEWGAFLTAAHLKMF